MPASVSPGVCWPDGAAIRPGGLQRYFFTILYPHKTQRPGSGALCFGSRFKFCRPGRESRASDKEIALSMKSISASMRAARALSGARSISIARAVPKTSGEVSSMRYMRHRNGVASFSMRSMTRSVSSTLMFRLPELEDRVLVWYI